MGKGRNRIHKPISPSFALCLFIAIGLTVNAQTINLRGGVFNKSGKPVSNATVTLVRQGLKDTTGTDGAYSITKSDAAVLPARVPAIDKISLDNGVLELALNDPSPLKIDIFDVKGALLKELSRYASAGINRLKITENSLATKLLVIRVSTGRHAILFRYLPLNGGKYTVNTSGEYVTPAGGMARMAAVIDTLKTAAAGYETNTTAISSYDQAADITLDSAMIITPDEYEPDNSRSAAHNISYGTETHTLTVNDTDWFESWNAPGEDGLRSVLRITSASRAVPITIGLYNSTKGIESSTGTTTEDTCAILFMAMTTSYYRVTSPAVGSYSIAKLTYADTQFTLHVTSPADSATYSIGQTITVNWSSNVNVGGYVDIDLISSGYMTSAETRTVASNVFNNGTYRWTIDTECKPGKYTVAVKTAPAHVLYGYSGVIIIKQQ